ncbi:MAG: acylphosphatase [Candidatus Micrarchaeota archaeon]|nr:acylphosphatase [Candidatus Micrarchaeota archaeon]
MKTVRVIIKGIVQGVGFRYFVGRYARQLGLRGWVKNNDDGSVEAVFQGDEQTMEKMLELCREGPSNAVVRSVEMEEIAEMDVYNRFSIKF